MKNIWLVFSFLFSVILINSCSLHTKAVPESKRVHDTLEIYEIDTISELESWVQPGTLVLFDLDNTVFESKDIVAHANWFHDMLERYPDQHQKILNKVWKAIKKADFKPVEKNTAEVIRKLQDRGIVVMALTARNMQLIDPTLRQLKSIGIDFTRTAPKRDSRYYHHGVLFADDNYPKGPALVTFLEKANFKPKSIILVDDVKKNLLSVCAHTGATGLYYPLIEKKRHVEWNKEEAHKHWFLD